MSKDTVAAAPPSRLKFWLLRLLKTIIGGFLTGVLIGIATMFLRDMAVIDPQGQETAYVLLTVAAWIAWLVYLLKPLFRRKRQPAST